jgi:hypothetical protein
MKKSISINDRIYIYTWMQVEIKTHFSEYLCHLLDVFNSKHSTNHDMLSLDELVQLRETRSYTICWWNSDSYTTPREKRETILEKAIQLCANVSN